MADDRLYKTFEKEINKDNFEIEKAKKAYIDAVKNGLGKEINNFNNYVKKEPSRWIKFKNFISKVFRYI
jgi:hypothetical protein